MKKLYLVIFLFILLLAVIIIFQARNSCKIERFSSSHVINKFLDIPDNGQYLAPLPNTNKPSDIKYQIPVPENQLTDSQIQHLDSDIIRNVRSLAKFSLTDELTFYQMYNLLKKYPRDNIQFIFNDANISNKSFIKLFYRLKLELISAFNNLIIRTGYYLPYHKYQFFKIINSNLISYSSQPTPTTTTESNVDNYIFTLTIAREFKYQQFVIYWDIDLITEPTKKLFTARINKIELIGIPVPKTIEFHDNKMTTLRNDISSINGNSSNNSILPSDNIFNAIKEKEMQEKDNIRKLDIYHNQVQESQSWDVHGIGSGSQSPSTKFIDITETTDLPPTMFNENSVSAMIEDKIMNIARDQQFRNHRCFGLVNGVSQELVAYNDNPIFCESYHPEVAQNGIWDAPCQVNSDCPFYKANKNYPNEFGSCDKNTGKCQMPLGIIPIGFTKYGKIEPKCYNCIQEDNSDNRCCSKQMNDIIDKKDNKLQSPDYIFIGDELLRRQFSNELLDKGLLVNPSI